MQQRVKLNDETAQSGWNRKYTDVFASYLLGPATMGLGVLARHMPSSPGPTTLSAFSSWERKVRTDR